MRVARGSVVDRRSIRKKPKALAQIDIALQQKAAHILGKASPLQRGRLAAAKTIEDCMLQGKSALVTGSTSGIGLAVARALAAQGANITINGFGDKTAIEKERAGIEKEFGVKAMYSGADMSKPAEIADMVKSA